MKLRARRIVPPPTPYMAPGAASMVPGYGSTPAAAHAGARAQNYMNSKKRARRRFDAQAAKRGGRIPFGKYGPGV